MTVIGLLIFLIVACVLVWGARAIMAATGIGDPIATIVYVLLVVILLLAFLGQVGYGPAAHMRLY
jgi:hypothetical protein